MKKIALLLFMAVIAVTTMSCDKETDTPQDQNNNNNNNGGGNVEQDSYFQWTVDGTTYLSRDDDSFWGYTHSSGAKSLQIYGKQDPFIGMRINIFGIEEFAAGTYSFDDTDMVMTYTKPDPVIDYVCNQGSVANGHTTGTLTITKWDTYVEGTFSFTGVNQADLEDKKQITEGSFKILVD